MECYTHMQTMSMFLCVFIYRTQIRKRDPCAPFIYLISGAEQDQSQKTQQQCPEVNYSHLLNIGQYYIYNGYVTTLGVPKRIIFILFSLSLSLLKLYNKMQIELIVYKQCKQCKQGMRLLYIIYILYKIVNVYFSQRRKNNLILQQNPKQNDFELMVTLKSTLKNSDCYP